MSQPLFTFDERIGLLFTVEGASLSICAVTVILCYALYKWLLTWRQSEFRDSEASDSILFLNLMLADLLQGIGTMPNIRWMNDGIVTEGKLCTTQAAVKQVGINGVALTSLAIALYSFIVLALRTDRTIPKHTSKVVVAGIWIFVALLTGVPNAVHRNDKYYGATQFWCWILPKYQVEQIVTEYLWVWFAALFMLLLYPIMFLLVRGWIGKKKAAGPVPTVHELHPIAQPDTEEAERTKKVAQKLLYYPLIYIVCILPNSVSRWLLFKGHHPSPKFIFAANTLFALSGLFNFILFFITRPSWVVGDRNRGERSQQSGRPTGKHGLPPPESSLYTSDPESPSGAIQPSDGIYGSTVVHSPKSHVSRSLPRERSPAAGIFLDDL